MVPVAKNLELKVSGVLFFLFVFYFFTPNLVKTTLTPTLDSVLDFFSIELHLSSDRIFSNYSVRLPEHFLLKSAFTGSVANVTCLTFL